VLALLMLLLQMLDRLLLLVLPLPRLLHLLARPPSPLPTSLNLALVNLTGQIGMSIVRWLWGPCCRASEGLPASLINRVLQEKVILLVTDMLLLLLLLLRLLPLWLSLVG
jgi:hypothetical protein